MLEGRGQVVKTLGVIYTEHPLTRSFESLLRNNKKSKRQIKDTFWGGMDGRQARPLDPAQGAGAQDDRAVYGPAGTGWGDQLRGGGVGVRYLSGGRESGVLAT